MKSLLSITGKSRFAVVAVGQGGMDVAIRGMDVAIRSSGGPRDENSVAPNRKRRLITEFLLPRPEQDQSMVAPMEKSVAINRWVVGRRLQPFWWLTGSLRRRSV